MRNAALLRAATAAIALFLFTGASHAQSATPLDQSVETRALAERSVAMVNRLVADDGIALSLGGAERDAIPVYLVRDRTLARVPQGCRCVEIGGQGVRQMEAQIAHSTLSAEDAAKLLAIILIHEIGHIRNGDHGAFLRRDGQVFLNNARNPDKDKEIAADDYVIEKLKVDPDIVDDTSLSRMELGVAISLYLFDLSTQNSRDCFAGRVLGSPCIFWDHSQSHPNFEYRLLRINHALIGSPVSKQLLEDFEQGRVRSGSLVIVGPDGERRTIKEGDEDYEEWKSVLEQLPGMTPSE